MSKKYIEDVKDAINIVDRFDNNKLITIAQTVLDGYNTDKDSRSEWEEEANKCLDLANMKYEEKTQPWNGAASIKSPMIARAAIQFASNALPELMRKGKAVQSAVIGVATPEKEARANRIEDFMNYQLLYKNKSWIKSIDRSLHLLAVIGVVFRKIYYDPITQENCYDLCLHDEIFINNNISCLNDAPRITHRLMYSTNELVELERAGIFENVDKLSYMQNRNPDAIADDPRTDGHPVLEQHCYLDLDEDGYAEPYIVTVSEEDLLVFRIKPNFKEIRYNTQKGKTDQVTYISPVQYFVDYHAIPALDGSYYSIGFGQLLHTLCKTENVITNQVIDAGTLANTQTGFISKGLNIRSQDIKLKPGYWHKVDTLLGDDIGRGIHQIKYPEPSSVLTSLVGQIEQLAKELSTTTDIMSGNQLAQNAPATSVLTLTQNSMRVFNCILKRVLIGLDDEFKLIYKLNAEYLDPEEYANVLDDPAAVLENDFESKSVDVMPIADPELSSDSQRLAQAQVLLQTAMQAPQLVNMHEVIKRVLEAANIKDIEAILPEETQGAPSAEDQAMAQQQQASQQATMLQQQALQLKAGDQQLKAQKLQIDAQNKARKADLEEKRLQLQGAVAAAQDGQARDKLQAELDKTMMEVSGKIHTQALANEGRGGSE